MPRELMSIREIKELNNLLRQVFEYITKLKRENRLADKIKYPQLPSILTESLAIHMLKERVIIPELHSFNIDLGGREADIVAKANLKTIKIEVKATAQSAFEYFGEKDIAADYILWFHFDKFYMNFEDTKIELYIIEKPQNYFNTSVKITLSKLKQIIGENLIKINIDFNSL